MMVTSHCPSWIGTTTRHRQDYPTPDLQSCCPLHVAQASPTNHWLQCPRGLDLGGSKEAAILSLLHSKSPRSQEGSVQVYQELLRVLPPVSQMLGLGI